jgi:hypothetical protein
VVTDESVKCPRKGCRKTGTVEVTRGALTLLMCPADAETIERDNWKDWVLDQSSEHISIYRREVAGT